MKIPRIMIAAPSSGSGKTLISCALLGAFIDKNIKIKAFKCGPDYIDPMFLKRVQNVPAENIDLYLAGEKNMKALFCDAAKNSEMALIEGVMGLYDGLGGITQEASAYHIAKVTRTPVILVVDAGSVGISIAALIYGFLSYDKEKLIKGVILNRISESFYKRLKPVIEEKTGTRVLGYFPKRQELSFDSRHLGLKLPGEIKNIKEQLKLSKEQAAESIELDALVEIAGQADEIVLEDESKYDELYREENKELTLAIARDEAFCFYYDANIRMFERAGVRIKYFSPLNDKALPHDTDGFILGGGYPELFLDKLEANISMRHSIREAVNKKLPSLAECGGFMYLHRTIDKRSMVGAIDADAFKQNRLVRFGYAEISEKKPIFLNENQIIKAHEFHYYDSTDNGDSCIAVKASKKESRGCIHEGTEHFWGFPHLYYPSAVEFVHHFINEMMRYHVSKID